MKQFAQQSLSYKLLVAFIVAASCLRIFICFQHNPMDYLVSDMLRHWNNGISFPRGGYAGAGDPIGYQVFICILHIVTRGNRFLVAGVCALLSVSMPWTYYRAARTLGLGKAPALWVWALIAWTPSLFVLYHFILMETLLLVLEGVAFWMTARYLRKGGTGAFIDSIFFWTLASLTKPTVVPLAVVCVLWSWWKKSTPWKTLAIGAVLAIGMLVPQAIRTKLELGFVAPFGNPWLTRIMLRSGARVTEVRFFAHAPEQMHYHARVDKVEMMFSSPSCYIEPWAPLSGWRIHRSKFDDSHATVVVNALYGDRDWKNSYARFNDDRDEWLMQWRENIVLFFFAPSWPETGIGGWDGNLENMARWMWAPLILIVFAGNFREFVARRLDLIPVAVTLLTLTLAFQNSVLMEGRYRKPVEPLLLLNLVWLVADAGAKSRRRNDAQVLASEPAAGTLA